MLASSSSRWMVGIRHLQQRHQGGVSQGASPVEKCAANVLQMCRISYLCTTATNFSAFPKSTKEKNTRVTGTLADPDVQDTFRAYVEWLVSQCSLSKQSCEKDLEDLEARCTVPFKAALDAVIFEPQTLQEGLHEPHMRRWTTWGSSLSSSVS